MVGEGDGVAVERCREIAADRWEAMMAEVERRRGGEEDFGARLVGARMEEWRRDEARGEFVDNWR